MKIFYKILLGFAVIFLICSGSGILYIFQANRIEKTALEYQHTDLIINELVKLQTYLVDEETGFRGFLLTGREMFLEPYKASQINIPKQFATLEDLFKDNLYEKQILDIIKEKHTEWLDSYMHPVMVAKLNEAKDPATYQHLFKIYVQAGKGYQRMVVERKRLAELLAIELQEDKKREKIFLNNTRNAKVISYLSIGAALILSLLIAYIITRNIRKRLNALAAATENIAAGIYNVPIPNYVHDELHDVFVSFRLMSERISESMHRIENYAADLEQFAWITTHDLREPLRNINTYIEIMEKKEPDVFRKYQEQLFHIGDNATRMRILLEGLLQFLRLYREDTFEEISVRDILDKVLKKMEPEIKASDSRIEIGEMPARVVGISDMVELLFLNLIENGIKFRRDIPPVLKVNGREKSTEWEFSVEDNGIGIDEQYKDKIFVIFQRLHLYEKYQSAGVGLALCKRIVEKHGGRIWFHSEPGQGSTFYFALPKRNATVREK